MDADATFLFHKERPGKDKTVRVRASLFPVSKANEIHHLSAMKWECPKGDLFAKAGTGGLGHLHAVFKEKLRDIYFSTFSRVIFWR